MIASEFPKSSINRIKKKLFTIKITQRVHYSSKKLAICVKSLHMIVLKVTYLQNHIQISQSSKSHPSIKMISLLSRMPSTNSDFLSR